MTNPKDKRGREYVPSVSEVAQIVRCEERVYLRAKYGESREGGKSGAARLQGEATHQAIDQMAREHHNSAAGGDRRCFIATAACGGDAPAVATLRRYRDRRLLGSAGGRGFVRAYYAVSPAIARLLDRHAWMKPPVRWVVERVAGWAGDQLDLS